MALQDILEKIHENAAQKAAEIIKGAQGKETEIVTEAQQRAKVLRKNLLSEASMKQEKLKDSRVALAQLEGRKSILSCRQDALSSVYKMLLLDLKGLEDKEYLDLIESIMVESACGDEEVIISSEDKKRITKKFIERVNKKLQEKNEKGALKLSDDTRSIGGGFVLRKERLEQNYSFSNLIKNIRETTEQEVVEILFGKK
ncbi:MAG: V-type ATP synthase subunit E family protein [bacterium]